MRRVCEKNSGEFTNVRTFSDPNINILCLFRLCCALLGSAPQASVAREGPIVLCHVVLAGFIERTALEATGKAAQLFVPIAAVVTTQLVLLRAAVLGLTLGVCLDQVLARSVAMACGPGVAIATAQDKDSGATPGVATGLTEATVPVLKQPAVDRMAGADAPVPMIAGTNPANYRCQAVEAMFH